MHWLLYPQSGKGSTVTAHVVYAIISETNRVGGLLALFTSDVLLSAICFNLLI
jgi:predicted aconitase with swiveling domain